MTQKKSSKDDDIKIEDAVEDVPELEVQVEGEDTPIKEAVSEDLPKTDVDVEALRKQIADLEGAQNLSKQQAMEAQRQAQENAAQLNNLRQWGEQSQYDSVVTAIGAAQMEVDSAKRDIVLAGSAQDFVSLADAQERLAAAKSHMISLEQSKNNYEHQKQQPQDPNPGLSYEEKSWLREHPDALSNPRKYAKLNSAYYDAMDKGLARGSRDYFDFIDIQLGYREAPEAKAEPKPVVVEEESSVMVAAPPSKDTSSGGDSKTKFRMTKEEAEIARLSNITPETYVKEREKYRKLKAVNPDDYPAR